MKRHKNPKHYFKTVVRGHSTRLAPPPADQAKLAVRQPAPPNNESAAQDLFEDATPADQHAARVMLVICLACVGYIGFLAWWVARMPEK